MLAVSVIVVVATQSVFSLGRALTGRLVCAVLAAAAIGLRIAWIMTNRAMRPLGRLAKALIRLPAETHVVVGVSGGGQRAQDSDKTEDQDAKAHFNRAISLERSNRLPSCVCTKSSRQ